MSDDRLTKMLFDRFPVATLLFKTVSINKVAIFNNRRVKPWLLQWGWNLYYATVDGILKSDHSNESNWAVLSCGTVYYAVQGGSNVWVCGWNPKVWPFKWKLLKQYFPVVPFKMLYKVALTFEFEILNYEHSNESYWAVLSCGTVSYAVESGFIFWFCGWNPKVWQSNKSYWAALSCGAVHYAVQGGFNFLNLCMKSLSVTIQLKATEHYCPVELNVVPRPCLRHPYYVEVAHEILRLP